MIAFGLAEATMMKPRPLPSAPVAAPPLGGGGWSWLLALQQGVVPVAAGSSGDDMVVGGTPSLCGGGWMEAWDVVAGTAYVVVGSALGVGGTETKAALGRALGTGLGDCS